MCKSITLGPTNFNISSLAFAHTFSHTIVGKVSIAKSAARSGEGLIQGCQLGLAGATELILEWF